MSSPSSTASSDPVPAHHKISYVEFASAHPQQSCDFFAALFGWRRESFGPDYVAFRGAGLAGGFYTAVFWCVAHVVGNFAIHACASRCAD